jgi:hypothetical protein
MGPDPSAAVLGTPASFDAGFRLALAAGLSELKNIRRALGVWGRFPTIATTTGGRDL